MMMVICVCNNNGFSLAPTATISGIALVGTYVCLLFSFSGNGGDDVVLTLIICLP